MLELGARTSTELGQSYAVLHYTSLLRVYAFHIYNIGYLNQVLAHKPKCRDVLFFVRQAGVWDSERLFGRHMLHARCDDKGDRSTLRGILCYAHEVSVTCMYSSQSAACRVCSPVRGYCATRHTCSISSARRRLRSEAASMRLASWGGKETSSASATWFRTSIVASALGAATRMHRQRLRTGSITCARAHPGSRILQPSLDPGGDWSGAPSQPNGKGRHLLLSHSAVPILS